MNTFKTKIENYLSKNCIFIFAIITFTIMLFRTPFWDETHAFNIAQLKLSEILYLTRIEGHPFLWYFLIKPFSADNLYPWSILIINWLFCIGAIFVLWKSSPFTPIQKALITFSTPFVYFFAPVARCYAIGILFLFLICAYYKKRFKHPFIFSTFILIAANTSVMAAIGAFYIGLLFLYDLTLKLKHKTFSKKNFLIVLSIFILCSILLILQFVGVRQTSTGFQIGIWYILFDYVIFPKATSFLPFIYRILCSIAFYFFTFYIFKKTKRGFFFIAGTFLTLSYIFLMIYVGGHWNHYFYYIYLIIFFWLFGKKILFNKFAKFLFIAILALSIFPKAILEKGRIELIYSSRSKIVAQQIIENVNNKEAKIYTLEWWSDIFPGGNIYLKKHGYQIFDINNINRRSFEGFNTIFYLRGKLIDFDKLASYLDENSYLATVGNIMGLTFKNLHIYQEANGDLYIKTPTNAYQLIELNKSKEKAVSIFKVIKL